MDIGHLTGVVFLNLKKAFDTVDHSIMMRKLDKFNLSHKSIKWFREYLGGRKQAVKYKHTVSSYLPITCGVPQGSILGPMMFIMYINDLSDHLNYCKASLYADDTALITSAETQVDIMLNLNIELSIINEWLKANKLTLDPDKTKYVIFDTKQKLKDKPNLNLTIDNKPIEHLTTMKYLGVQFDYHLTFDDHVNYVHANLLKS